MSKRIAIAVSLVAVAGLGGTVAWMVKDPLRQDLAFPAFAIPPPMSVEFHGDKAGVVEHSTVAHQLSSHGRAAFVVLANAEVFASPRVYYSGMLSPHAVAFRRLLREPAARPAFLELAEARNPSAALYGVSGLYLVDRIAYAREAERLRVSGMHFRTMIGCLGTTATITELLENTPNRWNIGSGYWPRALAGS